MGEYAYRQQIILKVGVYTKEIGAVQWVSMEAGPLKQVSTSLELGGIEIWIHGISNREISRYIGI